MDEKETETALVASQTDLHVALRGAASLWASATTSEGERRADLLRDKQRIVLSFFRHTGRLPSEVEPTDVQEWLRDLIDSPGLTSRAVCAREAGIEQIHLHQTRHTFARMVAEDTGSIVETQDALGHKHVSTTRVYVQRIAVRRDGHSERILGRLERGS